MCLIQKNEPKRLIHLTKHTFSCIIIEPLHQSHLLVIPKRHIENLNDFREEEAKDMFGHIEYLSCLLKEKFGGRGAFSSMNHHDLKTQEHIHFHMIAIDEGLRGLVSKYLNVGLRKRIPDDKLEMFAQKIKEHTTIK